MKRVRNKPMGRKRIHNGVAMSVPSNSLRSSQTPHQSLHLTGGRGGSPDLTLARPAGR
jgi:hypothetical protein